MMLDADYSLLPNFSYLVRSYLRLTVSGRRIDLRVDFLANFLPPSRQEMALLMSFTQASLSSRCVAWK